MTDIHKLIDAISATGLPPPEPHQLEAAINKDRPVKWSTNGKKSDRAGFCFVRQIDRILVASFGCMRSDIRENWSSKTRNDMPEVEWNAHIKRREELSKQLQEDAEFMASKAAITAQERWKNAKPADDSHQYLMTKNVDSYGLRVEGAKIGVGGVDVAVAAQEGKFLAEVPVYVEFEALDALITVAPIDRETGHLIDIGNRHILPINRKPTDRIVDLVVEHRTLKAIIPAIRGFSLVGGIGDLDRIIPLGHVITFAVINKNAKVLLDLIVNPQIGLQGGHGFIDEITGHIARNERREGGCRGQVITVKVMHGVVASAGIDEQLPIHQRGLLT